MKLYFEESTVNKVKLSVGKGLIYKCLAAPDARIYLSSLPPNLIYYSGMHLLLGTLYSIWTMN